MQYLSETFEENENCLLDAALGEQSWFELRHGMKQIFGSEQFLNNAWYEEQNKFR